MTRRTLGMYKSYNFIDKDPVIDIVRRMVELYGIENDLSTSQAMYDLSDESGVSYATMYNWFSGTTKRPQFATIQAVARACGNGFGPTKVVRLVKQPKVTKAMSKAA